MLTIRSLWLKILLLWRVGFLLAAALCDHTLSPCGLCVCVLCVVYVFSVLLSCTLF